MKCKNCGNEIEPGSRYCNVCGFFIVPEHEGAEIAEKPIFKDIPEDAVSDAKPEYKELPRKRNGVVFLLTALFVLLGLIVVLIIYPQLRRIQELVKQEEMVSEISEDDVSQTISDTWAMLDEEEDEETEEEDVYELSVSGEPGDKLMMVEGTIYNDKGGVISGLYTGESRVGEFYVSEDKTAGVLFDSRKKCLYITPDLKTTPLADGVYDAGLSYSGEYVFYKIIDSKYNKYLFLYNVGSGEDYLVDEADATEMIMSPSGEYIAYIKRDDNDYNKKLLMIGGWEKKPVVLEDDVDEIYAVSDDGKLVVYSIYTDTGRIILCWDNGKVVELANDYVLTMHFNRYCNQILYERENGAYYYEPGMGEPRRVIEGKPYSIRIDGAVQYVSPEHVNKFLYASETLEGAMVDTLEGLYMLGHSMDSVFISDTTLGALLIKRLEDKDICVFYDGDKLAYNTVDFDGNITTIYPIGEGYPGGYAINDDGSLLWYYDLETEEVYMVDIASGEKTSVFGKVIRMGTIALMWDSYTQRCFLVSEDGCSYGVDAEGNTLEFAKDCEEPYSYYDCEDYVGYKEKSREGTKHALIFGHFVELPN